MVGCKFSLSCSWHIFLCHIFVIPVAYPVISKNTDRELHAPFSFHSAKCEPISPARRFSSRPGVPAARAVAQNARHSCIIVYNQIPKIVKLWSEKITTMQKRVQMLQSSTIKCKAVKALIQDASNSFQSPVQSGPKQSGVCFTVHILFLCAFVQQLKLNSMQGCALASVMYPMHCSQCSAKN